jgi:hypothetical protein
MERLYRILKGCLRPGTRYAWLLAGVEDKPDNPSRQRALASALAELLIGHSDVAAELEGLATEAAGARMQTIRREEARLERARRMEAIRERLGLELERDRLKLELEQWLERRPEVNRLSPRKSNPRRPVTVIGPTSRAVDMLLQREGVPARRDRPLDPGGNYELLVNLGPYQLDSLVLGCRRGELRQHAAARDEHWALA